MNSLLKLDLKKKIIQCLILNCLLEPALAPVSFACDLTVYVEARLFGRKECVRVLKSPVTSHGQGI